MILAVLLGVVGFLFLGVIAIVVWYLAALGISWLFGKDFH